MDSISQIGEFGLIERLAARTPPNLDDVLVGIGDDCAVLSGGADGALILLTTDSQVAGVHFLPERATPHQLGRRAAAVNISDVAAMGGEPRHFLLSLGAPAETEVAWLEQLYDGFSEEACRWGADVVGGNTTKSPCLSIDVTLLGAADHARLLRRSGAKIGDRIIVTGTPGVSRAGLELVSNPGLAVDDSVRTACLDAHLTPTPRLHESRFISASGAATAMIDVSDGLLADLGHLCRASGCGAMVDIERLPLGVEVRSVAGLAGADPISWILAGGEDYELLFTIRPDAVDGFCRSVFHVTGCPATEIGTIREPGFGIKRRDSDGNLTLPESGGWDHFGG